MFTFLKHTVSQGRKRYIDEKYDLDLSYITPNIVAMGLPSSGLSSVYRNDINEVAEFLKEKHQGNFMIWNLSMLDYDIEKFDNQVLSFGFPDHHNPPIEALFQIVKSIDSWVKASKENVAVIHCKAGKGRTGTVICCYLIYANICKTSKESLELFKEKRSNGKGGSVDEPSQVRYVEYFYEIVKNGKIPDPKIVKLEEIWLRNIPQSYKSGDITLELYRFIKNIDLNTYDKEKIEMIYKFKEFKETEKGFDLKFVSNIEFQGDIIIDCNIFWLFSNELLFRFSLHTSFLDKQVITIGYEELDETYKSSSFKDFKLELKFKEIENKKIEKDLEILYQKF